MSKYSPQKKEYTIAYMKENYDSIRVHVAKGKKDDYKTMAADMGTSLQALIIGLLETTEQKYLAEKENK